MLKELLNIIENNDIDKLNPYLKENNIRIFFISA
jgi:hypothetical protein